MKVEYLKPFLRDLSKVTDERLKDTVFETILILKNTEGLNSVPNIKKLKGHPEAYRLRVGKYRLGFYFDGETVELARFAKRDDIYKLFP
ncbi:type II toxin-antitoxin system RelE/ParE family toxin [Flavobacterium sp.]|uniref:type II toxin-antitoxin system RelE family toxin n=1 Tax=Flavobacterium sp. TaxID=239 RepID=UPI0037509A74